MSFVLMSVLRDSKWFQNDGLLKDLSLGWKTSEGWS